MKTYFYEDFPIEQALDFVVNDLVPEFKINKIIVRMDGNSLQKLFSYPGITDRAGPEDPFLLIKLFHATEGFVYMKVMHDTTLAPDTATFQLAPYSEIIATARIGG